MTDHTYELAEQAPSNISNEEELKSIVESAFSTGLAAAIMSEFPVASILAISKGQKGKKLVQQADEITERTGIRGGAKRMLAKIFSIYGFINGIVCTVLYAILSIYFTVYFLIIILYFIIIVFGVTGTILSL